MPEQHGRTEQPPTALPPSLALGIIGHLKKISSSSAILHVRTCSPDCKTLARKAFQPKTKSNSVSTWRRASADDVNPPNPTVLHPLTQVHVSSLPAGTTGRRRCCRRSRRRRSCSEPRRAGDRATTATEKDWRAGVCVSVSLWLDGGCSALCSQPDARKAGATWVVLVPFSS